MTAFADVADLELYWRPLSEDEQARAGVLLGYAAAIIRARCPDVDARLADGSLAPEIPEMVSLGMVKRAMAAATAGDVSSTYQVSGPFSTQQSYANPQGNLYLSAEDLRALGVVSTGRAVSAPMSGTY